MENFFRLFDLFSQIPTLKVNGRTRASTILGSFVGSLSISFLTSGIVFILYNYFHHLSYNFDSFFETTEIPTIDLKKIKIGFIISDFLGNEFPDQEKIFSIQAKIWDVYIPFQIKKTNTVISFDTLNTIKCNKYKEEHEFKKEFEDYTKIYKNLECLDFESLNRNLTGEYGNFGK